MLGIYLESLNPSFRGYARRAAEFLGKDVKFGKVLILVFVDTRGELH